VDSKWNVYERKWQWPNWRHYRYIYKEGLRKTTKPQDSRCSGQGSTGTPPEYKTEQGVTASAASGNFLSEMHFQVTLASLPPQNWHNRMLTL
jgi:hypothetical protein